MEAQSSMDLFFSIRTTKTDSLSSLSFLIRTQWKYTQWNRFEITFVAENSPNLEANYYNIDTSSLGGCSSSKEVKVLLPFRKSGFAPIKALTFLNGFEISSGPGNNGNSPF